MDESHERRGVRGLGFRAERAKSEVDHVECSVERGRRWVAAQLEKLSEEKFALTGELGIGVGAAEREEEAEETVVGGAVGRKGGEVAKGASECRIGNTEQERDEERRGD